MRIGLLIYNLQSGGAERVLCKWSELFSEDNEVILYTFDNVSDPAYFYSGKLKTIYVPGGNGRIKRVLNLIKRVFLLKRNLKEDRIDLLISFCSTANFPTMLQNIPRYASIRLYSEYFAYQHIYRFLIIYTNCKLIVQTQRLKSEILKDVGKKYENKIFVIPNPLDIHFINEKKVETPEQKFIEKIKSKKVICFTGSFKMSKNHWNLIKSFMILHKKLQDTVLVLIGGNGELEEEIQGMVKSSPINDDIIFIGKTSNPFMYERMADVFVLPSLYEGIPNVLLEAMALGIPVISTDCPSGPREILYEVADVSKTTNGIEYADYGILVEPFPPQVNYDLNYLTKQNYLLAQAMESLLSDIELCNKYKKLSVMRSKRYNILEYKTLLKELIE